MSAGLAPDPGAVLPASARPPKLVANGVGKVFRRRRSEVVALVGVDLHVGDGELVCLLGASGCGKNLRTNARRRRPAGRRLEEGLGLRPEPEPWGLSLSRGE